MESYSKLKLWTKVNLNDLIAKNGIFCDGDWIESKDQDQNGEVRLIQLADIGDGVFRDKSDRYLTYKKAIELNCTFLKKNDILIARLPDPLGRACIFPFEEENKYVTAVDIAIVRLGASPVDNNFLNYWINTPQFRNEIERLKTGTTRYRISRMNLSKIFFPLPPLPEQYRIVAKIEELFNELDTGINALKKAKSMLEAYRQAVLKAAFEGRLTEEFSTKGWKNVKVKDLGKVETGTTPSKRLSANYGDRYLFFKPTDLNTGYNVFDSDDKLSELGFSKSRKLPKNSILVTCIGATIGKTGIIRVEGTSNQQINAIIPNSEINANFIYFQCISHYFQDQIKKNASSTTLPILNKSKFEQLNFKLPTRDQQDKIVKKLEMIFEMEGYINKNIENLLLLIEITKQSILKQAFSGKLVPQDPDDEPAEELLKRSKISNLAKQ